MGTSLWGPVMGWGEPQESAWAAPGLEKEELVTEEGRAFLAEGTPRREASWLTREHQERQ